MAGWFIMENPTKDDLEVYFRKAPNALLVLHSNRWYAGITKFLLLGNQRKFEEGDFGGTNLGSFWRMIFDPYHIHTIGSQCYRTRQVTLYDIMILYTIQGNDNNNDTTVAGWVLNHQSVDGFGLYRNIRSVAFDISILITS